MSGRLIFKNAAYLFISDVGVRFISALATILLARYLGARDYGILSVGLAFSSVAGYFVDSGLTHTVIREGTKPHADLATIISSFLKVRLVLSVIVSIFSIGIIFTAYQETSVKQILSSMVLPTVFGAALQGVGAVYFQIKQEMKYTAIIRSISGLINALALLAGIMAHWPLNLLAPVYGFSSLLGGFVSLGFLKREVPRFRGWNAEIMHQLLSFTLGGLLVMLLPQLGPLILHKVTDWQQVGYFSAAYRIPSVLYQIPGILAAAFYPQLFRYGNEKKLMEHIQLGIVEIKWMNFLGMLVALPFIFYPAWWIMFLFGGSWLSSERILLLLSFVVILQSINYPLADALTTKGLQSRRTLTLSLALIVGSLLYMDLGKKFGGYGGAVAAILIECLLFIGYTLSNSDAKNLIFYGLWQNVLAFLITFIMQKMLDIKEPIVGMLISLIVYIVLAFIFDSEKKTVLINWISKIKKDEK